MTRKYDLNSPPPTQILRKEYACDDEWICQFLSRAEVGHIATHWEYQPFITPMLFWYDSQTHEIYFHSHIAGRMLANIQRHPEACFESCVMGKLLPSNAAMEFAMQYESVVAFGKIRLLAEMEDKRRCLYGLIGKYFPDLQAGVEYRPITDVELKITAVFGLKIDSWSGKRNWQEKAVQITDWPALSE